jgi:maleate cis-trans isomerase
MDKQTGEIGKSLARVDLIIPASNTFTEPQFNHFAPPGLGIHLARARIAGEWKRPLPEMADEIATSAKLLSDCHPDVIVIRCTDTSMTQGPSGEGKLLDIVRDASGIEAMATSSLALEALLRLGMKNIVLLTPYQSNTNVIDYLNSSGIAVEAQYFGEVTPQQWTELAKKRDGPDVDGIFPLLHQDHPERSDCGY